MSRVFIDKLDDSFKKEEEKKNHLEPKTFMIIHISRCITVTKISNVYTIKINHHVFSFFFPSKNVFKPESLDISLHHNRN